MRLRLDPLALLALVSFSAGCRSACSPRHDRALEQQVFGSVSPDRVDLGAFLPLARAAVTRADRSKLPARPSLAGRRVIVTIHPQGRVLGAPGARLRGSATGASLDDAVIAAAESIPAGDVPTGAFRVELEALSLVEPIRMDADDPLKVEAQDLGLDGYAFAQKDTALGWLAPGEVLSLHAYKSAKVDTLLRDKLLPPMAARAALTLDALTLRKPYRFRTQAVVEASAGGGVIPLFRDWPEGQPSVTPEALVAAVRAGADYLCRVLSPQGKYTYLYRAGEDRDDPSYGNLRHAGTTYALLEAYDELRTPLYLEKADAALAFLKPRFKIEKDASGTRMAYLIDGDGEEQQKVGGAGLAMLALAKRIEVGRRAGSPTTPAPPAAALGDAELEDLRALGRFIVHAQYADGHFRANSDVERETGEQRKVKREVIYYAGEAILGLMRLYALDPDAKWLEAARKGADFVTKARDVNLSLEAQEHDHWISYALNELHRKAPDPAYVAHAWKVAKAIKLRQWTQADAPAPDFVGAFYAEAPSTPASTRLEAYDADAKLARYLGESDAWLLDPARQMAGFVLAQQFDDARGFLLPNPEKARGGVRESVLVLDVRIDYVQHAMSGWLHLARLLRDPAYGT
jgi:hypothetical protein